MATNCLNLVEKVRGNIPEFFSHKNVFITGFTGFLGKYLVHKLLTDIPDIGRIYVLMRESKKGTVKEKLLLTLNNPIFEHLRREPSVLDKIVPIEGDLAQLNLGISDDSRRELIDNVNIVYHVAASVRFDMPLTDAILLNVRGTREVCTLALDMKKCDVLMYVSSTYSQVRHGRVEEKLYPSPVNWEEVIETAERMDKFELSVLTPKYTQEFPNTYTFSKAIAESVVDEMCRGKIQTVIFRPSIVTSAYKGIIPGWLDNLNGLIGMLVATGKGIIRSLYESKTTKYDIVPVDMVINYMLKATRMQQFLRPTEISVYNCASLETNKYSGEDLKRIGFEAMETISLEPVWHCAPEQTQSERVYFINIFFFHFLPALVIDFFLGVLGKPRILAKLERKVYIATITMKYFMWNCWEFANDKCLELDEYMEERDKEPFYGFCRQDGREFMISPMRYLKQHILKEGNSEEDCRRYKKKRFIFAVLHLSIKYAAMFMIFYWSWNHVFVHILDNIYDYWESL